MPECVFTLPNGRKCRCMATRGHAFCRHHGAPRQPRRPRIDLVWNRLSCWRSLNLDILDGPKVDLPGHILTILQALWEDNVSDRYAGRALRLILKRLNAIPLMIDPEFEQLELPPPAPRTHRDPSKDDAERERLARWAESFLGIKVPRPQPPVAHSQPSAPALTVAR